MKLESFFPFDSPLDIAAGTAVVVLVMIWWQERFPRGVGGVGFIASQVVAWYGVCVATAPGMDNWLRALFGVAGGCLLFSLALAAPHAYRWTGRLLARWPKPQRGE